MIQSKEITLVDITKLVFNPNQRSYSVNSIGQVFNGNKVMSVRRGGYKKSYLRVQICRKDYYVHRLVLEAFKGRQQEGMQACHNDGNPLNNAIENLRWDTPKNNSADKIKHGTSGLGQNNAMAKITDIQAKEIAFCYQMVTSIELAKSYNIKPKTIVSIATGKIRTGIVCDNIYKINKEVAQKRIKEARLNGK